MWGEDNSGDAVNDISPNQDDLRLGWQSELTSLWLNMTYRQKHNKPGTAELQTGDVVYFKVGYEQILSSALTASLNISNLTDKGYPVSTDELAPNALGRNIELNLVYTF